MIYCQKRLHLILYVAKILEVNIMVAVRNYSIWYIIQFQKRSKVAHMVAQAFISNSHGNLMLRDSGKRKSYGNKKVRNRGNVQTQSYRDMI